MEYTEEKTVENVANKIKYNIKKLLNKVHLKKKKINLLVFIHVVSCRFNTNCIEL